VPVARAFIDYRRRELGVGGFVFVDLTGDIAADMARIADFHADKQVRHAAEQAPIRLGDVPPGRI